MAEHIVDEFEVVNIHVRDEERLIGICVDLLPHPVKKMLLGEETRKGIVVGNVFLFLKGTFVFSFVLNAQNGTEYPVPGIKHGMFCQFIVTVFIRSSTFPFVFF